MSANKVTLSNHCEKCEKETTREGKELEDEYKIHTHHYGNIQYSTICKIFGDELTYNELKPYADDPEEYGLLTVETLKIKGNNKMLVTAWVDIDKIMEKKFDLGEINPEYVKCKLYEKRFITTGQSKQCHSLP